MAIWWGTAVEVHSALFRVHGEGGLGSAELAASLRRAAAICDAALEVTPSEGLRKIAVDVIARGDLRAGDALQLASALVLCRERPKGRHFVCFDRRLAAAAALIGFSVLP
ncbi:MAG: hypothetical protein HY898_34425 [Deltaproteobacteria bacterium]|nr:hypothetical protein [Deltaproteobacteria bacterium]